jgi:adenylate cyclase
MSIPIYRRFHVRLTLIYGTLVFLVLTAMAVVVYKRGVASELSSLKTRIRGLATGLAEWIPADLVVSLDEEADNGTPAHRLLTDSFARMGQHETDVFSIYVLRPTERPGWLRFSGDWVRHGEAGRVAQEYDATRAQKILDGLIAPSVEDDVYTDEWGTLISGYAPIKDAAGKTVGLVGVDVEVARIQEVKRQVLWTTLAMYGVAAGLLWLIALIVGRNVRAPLQRLIEASSAIAAGSFETRAGVVRRDEFGLLARHFDGMAAGLAERELIRDTFGRYVSREVARLILASPEGINLGGVEREVTVMFSDLRGYSTISERLSPTEVVDLLNAYFGAMTDVIDEHGGTIIEFLGDGILVVFGAPQKQEDHAVRAVACARGMHARLETLNNEWEASGLSRVWKAHGMDRLAAGVALHSGTVVAGNLGSRKRVKYAVIGDVVNVASRVESLTKNLQTKILITGDVMERLPNGIASEAQLAGEHALKGREGKVVLYTLT